jgi:hypothetical protein
LPESKFNVDRTLFKRAFVTAPPNARAADPRFASLTLGKPDLCVDSRIREEPTAGFGADRKRRTALPHPPRQLRCRIVRGRRAAHVSRGCSPANARRSSCRRIPSMFTPDARGSISSLGCACSRGPPDARRRFRSLVASGVERTIATKEVRPDSEGVP